MNTIISIQDDGNGGNETQEYSKLLMSQHESYEKSPAREPIVMAGGSGE